ncbi:M14 family zinc carboxypeptidase [Streptomyces sp. NPDC091377]|uniref:M14 family zinc carboxypeptidase n=1 Tax=Streptomyces sp. NPDC091377 TaxID=3365995 RepID=UPI003800BCDA
MRTSCHPGYPAVGELERRARALASAAPGTLRLETVGESRAGRPLWLLSAGHGERNLLTVAGAHANEPVGGASALRLARLLAHRPATLERLGCTWHFLLCLDPDGARLAHGWAPEEPAPSVEECHLRFYRPAFARQPESLPAPGEDRAPLPESATLVALLDRLRPVAQFTLHGIEFGGAFAMMTRPVPGAARAFRATADLLRIPLDDHPCDGPDWQPDRPGVLIRPGGPPGDRAGSERDPSGFTADSTWLYPRRYGTLTTLIEAPAWAVPAVSDPRPAPDPGREVARVGQLLLGRVRELTDLLGSAPAALREPPRDLAPLRDAALELIAVAPSVAATWAAEEVSGSRGHFATLQIAARRLPLRAAGMMRRALLPVAPATAEALGDLVREWCQELDKTYAPRWVPIPAQTALHLRTMADIAERVCGPSGTGSRP